LRNTLYSNSPPPSKKKKREKKIETRLKIALKDFILVCEQIPGAEQQTNYLSVQAGLSPIGEYIIPLMVSRRRLLFCYGPYILGSSCD